MTPLKHMDIFKLVSLSNMASKTIPPPMNSTSRNKHHFSTPIVLLHPNDHTFYNFMCRKHKIKTQKIRPILVIHGCLKKDNAESGDGAIDCQRRIDAEEERKTRMQSKLARKEGEKYGYLVVAVLSTLGFVSVAVFAIYCRFLHRITDGEVPYVEMLGTFALTMGACVGMEYWARWAHRVLWHGSFWSMHKSHHKLRKGMLEVNDVLAISNAFPAISLLSYGFCNDGLFSFLCFCTGLGMTVFGISYMFIHDGLVHRRFPVGPIADCPYLQRVSAAHQLHHSEKLKGVPYGLFLGPQEIEEVGGQKDLEKEFSRRHNPNV